MNEVRDPNEVLEEREQRDKLLKEDIQQVHDENKADWVRALKSAVEILEKAKGEFSSADVVVVAGQMVVVVTNRRLAQRAAEARHHMAQNARSGVLRPQFN